MFGRKVLIWSVSALVIAFSALWLAGHDVGNGLNYVHGESELDAFFVSAENLAGLNDVARVASFDATGADLSGAATYYDETYNAFFDVADGKAKIATLLQVSDVASIYDIVNFVNADIGYDAGEVLNVMENFKTVSVKGDKSFYDRLLSQYGGNIESVTINKVIRPKLDSSLPVIGVDTLHSAGLPVAASQSGFAIAILDTGVESGHEFLPNIVAEACYSNTSGAVSVTSLCPNGSSSQTGSGSATPCSGLSGCGHGTHVAGIAGGKAGASTPAGLNGVAKGLGIVAVNVFARSDVSLCGAGATSDCLTSDIADMVAGLNYVASLQSDASFTPEILATNLSLGDGSEWNDSFICDASYSSVKSAVDTLNTLGIEVVASSGNDGHVNGISVPACISSIVSVASTNDSLAVSGFSNRGSLLDMFAPGEFVNSSNVGGGYLIQSGTSMSAPMVSGAIGLLGSIFTGVSADSIVSALISEGSSVSGYSAPALSVGATADYLNTNNYVPTVSVPTSASANPTLSLSVPSGINATHSDTLWEVATDSAFADTVWTSNSGAGMTSIAVNDSNGAFGGTLSGDTFLPDGTYYVRAKIKNEIGWGGYSSIQTMTVVSTYLDSISTTSGGGYYKQGDSIDIVASYSDIPDAGSSITLTLSNGVSVSLSTVSGNDLTGSYVVGSNSSESTSDLQVSSIQSQSVTFNSGAQSETRTDLPTLTGFSGIVIDNVTPVLAEITPVSSLTSDNTPDYVISYTDATLGTPSWSGTCSAYGPTTSDMLSSGNNTITFATMADGDYNDCALTVTDKAGNSSASLPVTAFTVDTISPTINLSVSPTGYTIVKEGDSASFSITSSEQLDTPITSDIYGTSVTGSSFADVGGGAYTLSFTVPAISDIGPIYPDLTSVSDLAGNSQSLDFLGDEFVLYAVPPSMDYTGAEIYRSSNATSLDSEIGDATSTGLYILTASELEGSDAVFGDLEMFGGLASGDEVALSKGLGVSITNGEVDADLILASVDRISEKNYIVGVSAGAVLPDATELGPVSRLPIASISQISALAGISILSSGESNKLLSSGSISVCLEGDSASYDVANHTDVSVYYSSDNVSWSLYDDYMSNAKFTSNGSFCFVSDRVGHFATVKKVVSGGSSSSSGGGGGGGGSSSYAKPKNNDKKDDSENDLMQEEGGDEDGLAGIDDESENANSSGSIDINSLREKIKKLIAIFGVIKSAERDIDNQIHKLMREDTSIADENMKIKLKFGDIGKRVGELQEKLREMGYENIRKTNIFDDKTKLAVMDFQKESGLQVDGIAGEQTLRALGLINNGNSFFKVDIADSENTNVKPRDDASAKLPNKNSQKNNREIEKLKKKKSLLNTLKVLLIGKILK